jgi:uncharacterized protein
MDVGTVISPWFQVIRDQVPGIELFDAHTHLGQNDPDGFKQSPQELLNVLTMADARGCFVFPMHEPDGYPPANDAVLEMANDVGDRFIPFCRVDPRDHAVAEAERSLAAGMRGIKLHPRAEQFTLDLPQVRSLFALADERSLPILIHAGRGIPALGAHVVERAREFPNARVILAHAGVCDLGWIWRAAADLPNLLFDSAWWMPADLMALFTLVPPGQIVFASDAPYGNTLAAGAMQFRLALQAGLSADQIRLIASGQSLRIADGEPLEVAGPAVGERDRASHILLDRVSEMLQIATMLGFRGVPDAGAEMLALARQACDVPPEIDDAPVFAAIRLLLDAYDVLNIETPEDRRRHGILMLAAVVAKTPDVPLPPVTLPDQA